MTRTLNRISSGFLQRAELPPGWQHDGGGLYLQVTHGTSGQNRSWVFRFTSPETKERRYMGLGDAHVVKLTDARALATEARALIAKGVDPLEQRRRTEAHSRLSKARLRTFADCAREYIDTHEAAWRNSKHRQQWRSTIAAYVEPAFGSTAVCNVDTTDVLGALKPIWEAKPETASRVRQRIEAILDWAAARGLRASDNPARWRGHLQKLLPAQSSVSRRNHPALSWRDMPQFWKALNARSGLAATALQLTILTAMRTSEVIGLQWSEVDFDSATWTVPAIRMKKKRLHRVPLSSDALRLLKELMNANREAPYAFPGNDIGTSISTGAMAALLERMERTDITVHGFRSTFRDWAAETGACSGEVAEAALAHVIQNKVEAAYRRGDLLAQRAALMERWARYCVGRDAL